LSNNALHFTTFENFTENTRNCVDMPICSDRLQKKQRQRWHGVDGVLIAPSE